MKKLLIITACLLALSIHAKDNIDYVNMYIGTTGKHVTKYGGTNPAICTPFAMTQWSPVTRENRISVTTYNYKDPNIIGFAGTHQPCIWMGDYGFFTMMPQISSPKISVKDRGVKLDRSKEIATPYYYKLTYGESDKLAITTEMTSTSRCAIFKIAYPKGESPILFIEAARKAPGGEIVIMPEKREIRLYNKERHDSHLGPELPNFKGYYVLKFNADFKNYAINDNGKKVDSKSLASGDSLNCHIEFDKSVNNLEIKIASSFIDYEQAQQNMDKEIANKSFDDIKLQTKAQWESYLNKLNVEGASFDDMSNIYTSLFRTLQFPREFSEYGRYYSGFDDKVHNGESYNTYSMWDTFRAQHPWLQLIAPEKVSPMMQALVQMYKESGWIPKWANLSFTNIMIGTHADAIIADAYINGFRDFDAKTAYEAMRKNATTPPTDDLKHRWQDRCLWKDGGYEARSGLTNYIAKGFVTADTTNESVSRTLEFALDDYCVAQMAKAMGLEQDYEKFMAQSKNYKNLYNPKTQFFHAKNSDGNFTPKAEEGLTEASRWHYRFCVMQDVEGLIDLMGGKEQFVKNLDQVFETNHYRHDNEPCQHYVYMYNYANRLDKTQMRMPAIIAKDYKNQPDGRIDNDDCGQMSAWYLYSILGFYPVCSASGEYALGIPKYTKATLKLANGKEFVVIAKDAGKEKTLTNVSLNGKKLERPFIKVQDVFKGGVLTFEKE